MSATLLQEHINQIAQMANEDVGSLAINISIIWAAHSGNPEHLAHLTQHVVNLLPDTADQDYYCAYSILTDLLRAQTNNPEQLDIMTKCAEQILPVIAQKEAKLAYDNFFDLFQIYVARKNPEQLATITPHARAILPYVAKQDSGWTSDILTIFLDRRKENPEQLAMIMQDAWHLLPDIEKHNGRTARTVRSFLLKANQVEAIQGKDPREEMRILRQIFKDSGTPKEAMQRADKLPAFPAPEPGSRDFR